MRETGVHVLETGVHMRETGMNMRETGSEACRMRGRTRAMSVVLDLDIQALV